MPQTTYLLAYDLGEVDRILTAAARAMAYDINTDLEFEDHPNTTLDTLKVFSPRYLWNRAWGGVSEQQQALGASVVSTKLGKFQDDFASFRKMFLNNFGSACEAGPRQGLAYLTEKQSQTRRSWANIKYRIKAAAEINALVDAELNKGIYTAFYVRFAADLGMNAFSAFGPLGFLANTLVSLGYCAACKLAENLSDGEGAEAVGFVDVANQAVGAVGNFAQERTAEKLAFHEAIDTGFKKSIETLSKEGAYSGRQTYELLERSMTIQRGYIKNLDKLRSARALSGAAQGGSFVVGLLFMAPQIKTAFTGDLRRMEGRPEVKR